MCANGPHAPAAGNGCDAPQFRIVGRLDGGDEGPMAAVPMFEKPFIAVVLPDGPEVVARDGRNAAEAIRIRGSVRTWHHAPACAIPAHGQCAVHVLVILSIEVD